MNEVNIKGKMFFFNGVYLSKEAIESIDWLQTGGTVNWDKENWSKRKFNNKVLHKKISNIDDILHKFIELTDSDHIQMNDAWKYIGCLNELRNLLKLFEAPQKTEISA